MFHSVVKKKEEAKVDDVPQKKHKVDQKTEMAYFENTFSSLHFHVQFHFESFSEMFKFCFFNEN